MSRRVNNFSAGPSTLPQQVLEEAQAEFVEYQGSGMSLIEMSHRGNHFDEVHREAIVMTRKIFSGPDRFKVLFLTVPYNPPTLPPNRQVESSVGTGQQTRN